MTIRVTIATHILGRPRTLADVHQEVKQDMPLHKDVRTWLRDEAVTCTPPGGDLPRSRWVDQDTLVTLTRNSHALTTPPTRLATAAGISQYKPPPALTKKVSPAMPTSTAVIVFGENLST